MVDHFPPDTYKISTFWFIIIFDLYHSAHFPNTALSGDAPVKKLSAYLPTLFDPPAGASLVHFIFIPIHMSFSGSDRKPAQNLAVFVGAMARGKDDFADAYVDEKIGVSQYALSASVACGKVCSPPVSMGRC